MVAARGSVTEQIPALDKVIRRLAKGDETTRRFMTVPGVGPVVSLAFLATIDHPERFSRARDVGAYLGLTPKRYQSRELDLA